MRTQNPLERQFDTCAQEIDCIAAGGGHMDFLRWLCAYKHHETVEFASRFFKDNCRVEAEAGNLDTLQWALSNGAPCDVRLTNHAACSGHLHVIKFLVSQAPRFRPGCRLAQ
eukprot:TRINITY_DN25029_c0_g1_i1.p1 TRINITY_DN25029_c0_g1~~TRINITY_DN25029_c0_g1_i1.p1  ORF type:complete len:112 (+),score=14.60 TRINITY_DN25029_c0_g1_i1:208-543(+)